MKWVSDFRRSDVVRSLSSQLHAATTGAWRIMEVCGGQTHSIMEHGLNQLLPSGIELLHGPGCPVCVTPEDAIDNAVRIMLDKGVTILTYGDMVRVPGTRMSLAEARALGGKLQIVHGPLDALAWATKHPQEAGVFFAIGFETTAAPHALLVEALTQRQLANLKLLVHHVLVPPALRHLLSRPEHGIHAFLAAGHVCTVTGWEEYDDIAESHQVPIIITGFEPVDILLGALASIQMLERGEVAVRNEYARSARRSGNDAALRLLKKHFSVCDVLWRGMGRIPRSGLCLSGEAQRLCAREHYALPDWQVERASPCKAGDVLMGKLKPDACPEFAVRCHPDRPLGAPMVSAEGACSSYFRFRSQGRGQL